MSVTENITAKLRASAGISPIVFDNHSQDCRYTGPVKVSQTVSSTFGTGGNNQPLVEEFQNYGEENVVDNSDNQQISVRKPYNICLKRRNNTSSGIYKAETSRTLDTKCNDPSCNQGGMVVVMPQKATLDDVCRAVRRLMPRECAKLQGFPAWWCSDLETESPSEKELEFWAGIFEEHRKIK